jgi:hypothetical protein
MLKAVLATGIFLMCGTMLANAQVSSGQGEGSATERSHDSGNRGTPATGYWKYGQIKGRARLKLGASSQNPSSAR